MKQKAMKLCATALFAGVNAKDMTKDARRKMNSTPMVSPLDVEVMLQAQRQADNLRAWNAL